MQKSGQHFSEVCSAKIGALPKEEKQFYVSARPRKLLDRGPWKLIYYEAYLERDDALGRERYLKSGSGRKFLKTQLRRYLEKNPFAA